MASFHSGVLLTKQHSERNKNDERRNGPRGEDNGFHGAVMSKRQPRKNRVEEVLNKEKDEADAFPMDISVVLAKKPDARLKWLHRGLMFAGKKYVQVCALYDIATNKKFVLGISAGVGRQMQMMLLANLHLFSLKQQRFLQSDASQFHEFVRQFGRPAKAKNEGSDSDSGASPGRQRPRGARGRSASSGSSGGHSRRDSAEPERRRRRSVSPGKAAKAARAALFAVKARVVQLSELSAGSENPLRPPPMATSRGYVCRYPFPLPDIVPGEDVRKYAFGTADDFLTVGDDVVCSSWSRKAVATVNHRSRSRSQRRG